MATFRTSAAPVVDATNFLGQVRRRVLHGPRLKNGNSLWQCHTPRMHLPREGERQAQCRLGRTTTCLRPLEMHNETRGGLPQEALIALRPAPESDLPVFTNQHFTHIRQ